MGIGLETLVLAKELEPSGGKANSCCPGWVMTDMGEEDLPDYGEGVKPKTTAEGADTPVWLATLPADGPTGEFFSDRKPRPW
jgi:NAD(P)-dependent dehydrogenase (short-subunit alcohol dehydrogenase family)